MDDSVIAKLEGRKRLRRSIAEKHRIAELATQPGASVARVAQQQGVNANQVHDWRRLYRHGRLGQKRSDTIRLLLVRVRESTARPVVEPEGSLEIRHEEGLMRKLTIIVRRRHALHRSFHLQESATFAAPKDTTVVCSAKRQRTPPLVLSKTIFL